MQHATTMSRPPAMPALILLLVACLGLGACAPPAPRPITPAPPPPGPALDAAHFAPELDTLLPVLWLQTAAEYRGGALQAYAAAHAALDRALADPGWTAAQEQGEEAAALPPAIILDVDETVLDNTPYQARLLHQGSRYDLESWHAWCEERQAKPVPGAVAFTQYAASRGVTVFYVTNRRAVVTAATRDNLERQGFPLASGRDVVLTRGLKPEWDSADKGPRRAAVAREFRILLLVGDDLGDFLSGNRTSPAERARLVAPFEGWWGSRWIVVPNPIYGSWADAILGFAPGLSEQEALKRRREALGER